MIYLIHLVFVLDVLWQHHEPLLKISHVLIHEVLRLVDHGWLTPFSHREMMGSLLILNKRLGRYLLSDQFALYFMLVYIY